MNINDLLNSGANVAITITPTDLKEFALTLAEELTARHQEKTDDPILAPDEVAAKLGVSTNTLWRWQKSGYLVPVRIGRKPRYRLSDVEALTTGQQGTNKPVTGHCGLSR